jgi:hypothetical protein
VDWLTVTMLEHRIKPEIEAFDLSMIIQAARLQCKGVIGGALHVQLVMGIHNAIPAERTYRRSTRRRRPCWACLLNESRDAAECSPVTRARRPKENSIAMMRRRVTAIALLVSFLAMSTSGLLMLIVDRPSFTIQMHPVHKLFGIVMIVAALSHIQLNARAIGAHLTQRNAALFGVALVVALLSACVVVVLNPVPAELAKPLDQAAQRAEHPDGEDR